MDFTLSGSYTDLYQIAMGQAYYLNGHHDQAVTFDYFFRKTPYHGSYVIFAGLSELLETLQSLRFTTEDLRYLEEQGFDAGYLEMLKNFRFNGTIYSVKEGEVVFPNAPILRVEGAMLEVQLIETMLLNILNFQSLIATKASRVRLVAGETTLSEFGLRRAQGFGATQASRAAYIGGFDSTSNVYAAKKYNIPSAGTMAHSFVQMYDDELTAFRQFAKANPTDCVLLVDTYNTLNSGIPNAIKVAQEMEADNQQLVGIRLDSGDLSYFSRKARQLLDAAGLSYVKIAASNQLDEYLIRSLLQQNAPIDLFGVGTNLITGQPDAALDGVFKLVMANGSPRIKVSESIQKTTLPGNKQVYRLLDETGQFSGTDAIAQLAEGCPDKISDPFDSHKEKHCKQGHTEALLQPVMEHGVLRQETPSLEDIRAYSAQRLRQLPAAYKRFEYPHLYKVGISPQTKAIRDELRLKYAKNAQSTFNTID